MRTLRWILVLHILGAPWVEGMVHPTVAAPLRSFHDDVNGAVRMAFGYQSIDVLGAHAAAGARSLPDRVPLFGGVNRRIVERFNG
jgi:hypothetical protein